VTQALFNKKKAEAPAAAAGAKSRFSAPATKKPAAAKFVKPAAGQPYLVDGQLWVCQGCGYVYDGQKGPWAEDKRCPACGERRFALKSQEELSTAIYALAAAVALIGVLALLPTL